MTRADGIIIAIIAEIFEVIRNEQKERKTVFKEKKIVIFIFARNGVCERLTEVCHKLS